MWDGDGGAGVGGAGLMGGGWRGEGRGLGGWRVPRDSMPNTALSSPVA